ncbi:MAG: flagellar basal body-associated FliL family protein [Desulfovibrio sp.]|jgi:flagellar FliL protein|nr:flagellar basal body-associated FliL family protein [Desulfovibrio sp.]
MLFLVPDDSPAREGSADAARGVKVELDIEDAPFLQEPEETKPQAKNAEKPVPVVSMPDAAPSAFQRMLAALFGNKKRLAAIACGLLAILLAPIAVSLFLNKANAPSPPVQEAVRRIVPDAPPRENAPAGPKFLFKGEPFLIECRGNEGEIRFLRCRFAVPTDNAVLYAELQAKNIALRDAIYYYLINKPITFLSDNTQTEVLKKDIMSVINEQISSEKILELYIEEYLVTRL